MRKLGVGLLMLATVMSSVNGEAGEKRCAGRISVSGDLEKSRDSSKNEGDKSSSRSKTEAQHYELTITAANTGKIDGSFDVEWYFFKRALDKDGDKGDVVLSEKGKKTVKLKGLKRIVIPVNSKVLTWSETKSTTKGSSNKSSSSSKKVISGEVYDGYLVLLKYNGEIISRYSPDRKCKSDEWLGKMSIPFK